MKKLTFLELVYLVVFTSWLLNIGKFAEGNLFAWGYLSLFTVAILYIRYKDYVANEKIAKMAKEVSDITKTLKDDKPQSEQTIKPKTP